MYVYRIHPLFHLSNALMNGPNMNAAHIVPIPKWLLSHVRKPVKIAMKITKTQVPSVPTLFTKYGVGRWSVIPNAR